MICPDCSSRSIRALAVARETPRSLARSEMLRRALWRSSVISFWSSESIFVQYGSLIDQNDKSFRWFCQSGLFILPAAWVSTGLSFIEENGRVDCKILGAPVQDGAGRMGCEMGPSALRTAGLA